MIFCLLIGLIIGLSASLLGLGGNIFIVPLLPLFTDFPLREVIATGIFTVFFVCLINVFFFWKKGLIDFKTCLSLILPTSIGSYASSYLSGEFSENLVLTLLIVTMSVMLIRLNITLKKVDISSPLIFMLLGALISGFIAGLTGIGSGVILGPMLLAFGLVEPKRVSPIINVMIVVACFFSLINYLDFKNIVGYQVGSVHTDLSIAMIIPAGLTSIIGRKFNDKIDPVLRKKIVSLVLVILIFKLIITR